VYIYIIYIFVYICIYIFIHMYIHTTTCTCIRKYVNIHIQAKEICAYVKRGMCIHQKRHVHTSKETITNRRTNPTPPHNPHTAQNTATHTAPRTATHTATHTKTHKNRHTLPPPLKIRLQAENGWIRSGNDW